MADPGALVEDDLLRLVLMCTHPALAPEAASALSLRLVLGVPTPDIARLFLVPEADHGGPDHPRQEADRRGRHPVRACPTPRVLPDRLDTVAQTAYLAFTAGYSPGTGPDLLRAEPRGRGDPTGARRARAASRRAGARRAARADAAPALAPRRPGRATAGWCCSPTRTARRWHHDEIDEAHAAARPRRRCADRSPRRRRRTRCRRGSPPSTRSRQLGRGDALGPDRRAVRPPARARTHPVARLARAVAVAEAPRAGRGSRRAGGHRDPRRATASPPYAPSCWRAPATSTPRGRRTTRRSRPAATTSSGPTCSARRDGARVAGYSGTGCCLASTVSPSSTTNPRARSSSWSTPIRTPGGHDRRPCRGSRCARPRPRRRGRRPSAPSRRPRRRP